MTNFPPADSPAEDLPEHTDDQSPVEDLIGVPINPTADVVDAVEAVPLGVASGDTATDDPVLDDPALGDGAPVVEQTGDEVVLAEANTSLPDDGDTVNAAPDPTEADAEPGRDGHYPPDQNPTDQATGPLPGSTGQLPPTPTGPPGYGPQPPVRRIYRSRHDRKLGGVSAGIAEFFQIDPTIVRLATLVAAITGIGFLVYVAAWFIIPLRPEGLVEAPRTTPLASERTLTLTFGIAALALAFGIVTGSWAVLALALIGGGVWLLSQHTAMTPGFAGASPVSGTAHYQPSSGFEPSYPPPTPGGPGTYVAPPPPPYVEPPAPKEHKPQRITWTVLSLLALLAAVGLAASTGDWWNVSATRLLGIGVVTIGVGVVAGQLRSGGARGLIPLGILAALALVPVSAVDGLLDDGVGEATYRPTSIAELETTYEHGIGQLVVDLSELDFGGRTDTIDINLGIGELIVIVSKDTGGQAVLQARAGEISHFRPNTNSVSFDEGLNVDSGAVVFEGENGSLDLNINVGLGTAELRAEGS